MLHHSVAKETWSSKLLSSNLIMTDVLKNKTSYYKLQVVVSDASSSAATATSKAKPQKFYFVRAWGRVGCDGIGGSQVRAPEMYTVFRYKFDGAIKNCRKHASLI